MNYAEIGHSQHDFVLTAARVPVKFPSAVQAEFMKTGILSIEPEVQITFPPSLVRPLIDALVMQLGSYERALAKNAEKGSGNGKGK